MFPGLYKTYFYRFSHFKVFKKNGFWTFINVHFGPLEKQNAREKKQKNHEFSFLLGNGLKNKIFYFYLV